MNNFISLGFLKKFSTLNLYKILIRKDFLVIPDFFKRNTMNSTK
ncbi:hypothetical protein EV03_1696 [Prochlorococcus marinus str. PAC1]|uniref:Uncharacterized protein n=1 Tax=Prochlorococcus marinus str. PAC1 TaxID=59924 RepID=A0A0A2C3S7_PROMR|nr:hypothetical protein EV03_1696 [Prochlorococcus marinus str. PAC1]